jgi:hypothetical protein
LESIFIRFFEHNLNIFFQKALTQRPISQKEYF